MIALVPMYNTAPEGTSCGFAADSAGQVTIEWALVLAAVALPMYFVIVMCLNLLVAHFRMVTFMETLPFP